MNNYQYYAKLGNMNIAIDKNIKKSAQVVTPSFPTQNAKLSDYISITRMDHWAKNIFVIPGAIIGLYFFPETFNTKSLIYVILAIFSTCLVASSNYVINEYLDAPQDRFHPIKKLRPCAAKNIKPIFIYSEWLLLAFFGIGIAFSINTKLGLCALSLWVMGCVYNIKPIRSKELPYLDVLSESLNNPIRMAIGWYALSITILPPVSALFAYWMFGAFLMGTKRFAEYRKINNPEQAALYRRSFKFYTEELLLAGNVFYLSLFMTGLMAFSMLYKLELVFAIPLVAYIFAYYLYLGFKENSPVQYPEKLYKEKHLMFVSIACFILGISLYLFADFQWFKDLFQVLSPSQLKY